MSERGPNPAGSRKRPIKPLALDVRVPAQPLDYSVLIGRGVIERVGEEIRQRHGGAATVALVSDSNVAPLHGAAVRAALERSGLQVAPMTVPAGEASKSAAALLELTEQLLRAGIGRRDVVVALGGGVIGDLAGLAAALYMRGIPVVQCPTSLLAQVDASVGGKVAIDLPGAKNLLGVFHFPSVVLVDPDLLATLPEREFCAGLAEMLKHGALFSPEHFREVVEAADAIHARDFDTIARLLATSVGLKAACVGRDPWEQAEAGKGRVLLNLGHTLGHAIEVASSYQLVHGEAVALGMRAAARVAIGRGLAAPELEATIVAALARLRLPTDLDAWLTGDLGDAVERLLAHDKKRSGGQVSYVVIARLGEPSVISLHFRELMALARQGTTA
jgi:3-dehydroquinate synthase